MVEYEALPSSVDNLSSIQRETGCEQPSPVSVLDLCYEEEGSVSMELKQINSDIQGGIFTGPLPLYHLNIVY